MEKAEGGSEGEKLNEENPNSVTEVVEPGMNSPLSRQSSRTPFTNLSQVDADLALARTLQEQERTYMMLRMNGEGIDYGISEAGSYEDDDDDDDDDDFDDLNDDEDAAVDPDDEDAFDVHEGVDIVENDNQGIEFDPSAFPSDEAYARALQDAEEREMAIHLMALAGINDREYLNFVLQTKLLLAFVIAEEAEDTEDLGSDSQVLMTHFIIQLLCFTDVLACNYASHTFLGFQDTWEDIDPDELSYEELLALGEAVGTESRGLSADAIASLPSINYKAQSNQDGNTDQSVLFAVLRVSSSDRGVDLSEHLIQLSLSENNKLIVLDEDLRMEANHDCVKGLLGRFATERSLNWNAVKATMITSWRLSKGDRVTYLNDEVFVLKFEDDRDMQKVLRQEPWTFNGHILQLTSWEADSTTKEVQFSTTPFWAQLHELLTSMFTQRIGEALGKERSEVLEVDLPQGIHSRGKYLRVRVRMDIGRPLQYQIRLLRLDKEPAVIEIRYERLPVFCYHCGLIGHDEKSCSLLGTNTKTLRSPGSDTYVTWLRADYLGPSRVNNKNLR
ncbi:hypothetical protein HHK36_006560 [Tetracentron sinense]|uniref:CCHC-type domain-containing protein n=1 Tax=Tetracentron sinense TaxID=13715 RepID=A0A834ZJ80_TETSI|nr:hypothetical protein HHK36_006560 [Tetracentron sinense]